MVKIGWGRREISLDEPLSLRGQMHLRISQGIHDPMFATALCVEGEDTVIFCSLDIVTIENTLIHEIKEAVAALCQDCPVDGIILNATHTHAGGTVFETPETSPDGRPIYPGREYRRFLVGQCAQAIVDAYTSRKTGGMTYGYGYAVVAHSRRSVYFEDQSQRNPSAIAPNGHGIMYGNSDDEQFSHFEGGADHFLNLMFTFDERKTLTGIVINVPCPAQVGGQMTQQSADYWHEVRQQVKESFGEGVYVLTQCAPAGDLSPRVLHYREAQERRMGLKYGLHYTPRKLTEYNRVIAERRDIAQRILQGVQEVYSWARGEILWEFPVRHRIGTISLARRMITEAEVQSCQDTLKRMESQVPEQGSCTPEEYSKAYSRYASVKRRNEKALQRYALQHQKPTLDTVIHTVQLGPIAFTTTRFELYHAYMHRIQARSPFIQTFVVQLAGDGGASYLPTREAVNNKGYSASMFCNHVGPEGGQQIVEYTLEVLAELYHQ